MEGIGTINPMRFLFLSFACPLPANNGQRMRTWAVLKSLAAEGHELTLLTFGEQAENELTNYELQQVCQTIEIIPLALRSLSSTTNYLARFAGIFTAKPYAARRFVSSKMREAIEVHLSRGLYDAVVCDAPYTAVNLPATDVPVILNGHNVEHRLLSRYVAIELNPFKRLYAWSEMQKLRKWEQSTCRQATAVLACSELDRQLLSSLVPGLHVTVVPNVVDIDSYLIEDLDTAPTIQFQGGMDWLPNRDAVSFFVGKVHPILRQLSPQARFVVAGRNPSADFIKKFINIPGIEFTGNVPDMRAEIAKATVCVVPLRIGSGTRLKILESAAMAKPIVSTRIGAEGLDFVDGEEIVLADEPMPFARAVADLLADPSRRRALGLAARRRVEAQYSMASLRIALRETLAKIPAPAFSSAPLSDMKAVEGGARP